MANLNWRGGPVAVDYIAGIMTMRVQSATWRDSGKVCAFADAERHLGHIVRAGSYWLAYDATHLNETGTGFRLLGTLLDINCAKQAVEQVFLMNQASVSGLQ
jgi:hypothetical protein